ncbi:MAG: heparinase II/III family protein [Caldilineaceae bacterium]|nr:heparinase II/III family protein [Caldilineaceae bacterium]
MRHYLSSLLHTPLNKWPRKIAGYISLRTKVLGEEALTRLGIMHRVPASLDVLLADSIGNHIPASPWLSKQRQVGRFFIGIHEGSFAFRQQFSVEAKSLLMAQADRICEHVFDILGSGPIRLGESIHWHTDFKTGYRWNPKTYYKRIRPAPYPGGYDIKVPWELSRCQHFAWLGQAYWFTEDEKHAQEFVAQVRDWIESNPWPWGVNWTCTMDVAIRAVNWIWGYYFFEQSPSLSHEFRLAFYKSLLVHGRHIWRNLENHGDFTGNHYLSNLVGLVYLGIMCPAFKEAHQWRDSGLCELENEMFKQVYADGVNFEASTSYHRLVLEMFLSATILAYRTGYRFGQAYMERLEKMVEFIMYLTKPDGTAPLIGDNDNGRLHRLKVWYPPEREWVDFRYLLAIGAVLFQREDFALAAEDQWEEAIWLCGKDALEFKQRVKQSECPPLCLKSRSFPNAGLYFMRHGDSYLAIDAGSNGQQGKGGHAHNDTFSFVLQAHGKDWIIDPGMYTYTGDYNERNRFRSTSFHNTVAVDGQEQTPISSSHRDIFRLPDLAHPKVICWSSNDEYDLFIGEHYGYKRFQPPVVHRRTIFFDKLRGIWLVHDRLVGEIQHRAVVTHLHFSPDVELQSSIESESSIFVCSHENTKLLLVALHEQPLKPALRIRDGHISPGYGLRQAAYQVIWEWPKASQEFTFAMAIDPPTSTSFEQITFAHRRYREVKTYELGC